MKFYCISDGEDTKTGMRLAGIEGRIVKTKEEVLKTLNELFKNKEIAVILITEKLVKECQEEIFKIKTTRKIPLLVTIPGEDGKCSIGDAIKNYINESIGIKI